MRSLRVFGLALLPLAAPYGLQEMLKGNDPSKADLETWKGQYLSPEMGGQVDKAFAKHRGDILSTKAQLYKGFQSLSADIQGKSGEANSQLVTTLGSGSGREHATMIAAERHRKKREVEDANSFTRRQKRFTPQGADVPTFDSPGLTADEQLNAISKGGVKEGADPLAAAEPLIEQRERLYRTQREQKLAAQRGKRSGRGGWAPQGHDNALDHEMVHEFTDLRSGGAGPRADEASEGERISAAIIAERRRQAAKIHMSSKESDELELSGTTKGLGLGLLIASIVLIARGAGGRKE